MTRIICAVSATIVIGFFLCAGTWAANQDDLNTLNTTKQCPGCDLSNANLSNMVLTGANLKGANLTGANLAYANLSNANLRKANLTNANMVYTNLTGTHMSRVNPTNTNFTGATWIDGKMCMPGSIGQCNK